MVQRRRKKFQSRRPYLRVWCWAYGMELEHSKKCGLSENGVLKRSRVVIVHRQGSMLWRRYVHAWINGAEGKNFGYTTFIFFNSQIIANKLTVNSVCVQGTEMDMLLSSINLLTLFIVSLSPLVYKLQEDRNFCLICLLIYPQSLCSRLSIDICWINVWVNE